MSIVGGKNITLINISGDSQCQIKGLEASVSGYSNVSVKASVKVTGSACFYFEVKVDSSTTQFRVGWVTDKFQITDKHSEGLGTDGESWGFDAYRRYINHKAGADSGATSKSYGDSIRQGDVIGCLLDLELCRMSFSKNGTDMGVAFNGIKPTENYSPAVTLSRSTKVTFNFNHFSKSPPPRFLALSTDVAAKDEDALNKLYQHYFAAGISLSESGDTGCIKGQGILDLAKDLGQVDDADPILLILAWKLRCESTWEITHSEFVDGFGGQYGVSDLAKMKKLVQDWRTEIKNDKDSFRSLYNFIFDYLRPDRATAIDKEEALLAWGMIEMGKRWKLWTKWEEHVKTTESIKSVTRDTWTMLLNFIDSVGDDIKNYDSMDCWPIAIDEFVEWLESHK